MKHLSSTTGAAGIFGFLQRFLLSFVFGPPSVERLIVRPAFGDAAPALDQGGSHWFEQDAFRGKFHDGLRSVLNVKLFAKPGGNDHLAFAGEPNGISFPCGAQRQISDMRLDIRQ